MRRGDLDHGVGDLGAGDQHVLGVGIQLDDGGLVEPQGQMLVHGLTLAGDDLDDARVALAAAGRAHPRAGGRVTAPAGAIAASSSKRRERKCGSLHGNSHWGFPPCTAAVVWRGDAVTDDGNLIAAARRRRSRRRARLRTRSRRIAGHRRVAVGERTQRQRKHALALRLGDLLGFSRGVTSRVAVLPITVLVSLSCLKVWSTASTRTSVKTTLALTRLASPLAGQDQIDAIVGQDEAARA